MYTPGRTLQTNDYARCAGPVTSGDDIRSAEYIFWIIQNLYYIWLFWLFYIMSGEMVGIVCRECMSVISGQLALDPSLRWVGATGCLRPGQNKEEWIWMVWADGLDWCPCIFRMHVAVFVYVLTYIFFTRYDVKSVYSVLMQFILLPNLAI